jgi:hypothetical protein
MGMVMVENYRLYVETELSYFETFEAAKEASEKFMSNKPELRIELLTGPNATDFWAYEYEAGQWIPS